MAIQFTAANTVAKGDAITSTQLIALANAFNDRIKSGLGDPTERIFFNIWSIFNQVRNRDGSLCASKSEFFEYYQMLNPDQGEWPTTTPGDPQGANLETPINAFTFGNVAIDLNNEPVRLATHLNPVSLSTPATMWHAAKQQRGVIDINGGINTSLNAPALEAGWEHLKMGHYPWSPHGNSYGGFLPGPAEIGSSATCLDTAMPLLDYFFTRISDGAVIHYSGPCSGVASNWNNPTGTRMVSMSVTPFAYHILKQDGGVDILPINQYIEGPYTHCGVLQKKSSGMLGRVLNAWMAEFRGSDEQFLANSNEHLQHAFDFERYLSHQNQLAPNKGTDNNGVLVTYYPLFSLTGSNHHNANTLLNCDNGGTSYQYGQYFSLGGAHILCSKLASASEVVFLNGTTELKRVTVSPDGNGDFSLVVLFNDNSAPNLKIKLASDINFTNSSGYISIECSELLTSKPSLLDAYVLLRLGSAGIVSGDSVEGVGISVNTSKTIGDDYFDYGCIVNRQGESGLQAVGFGVNRQAMFDAARRFSQFTRCMNRQQFAAYEVIGGKTNLYFKRYANVDGKSVDMFDGMFPIINDAFVGGWSNEWVLHISLKPYSSSNESPWKVDAYSDWNPFVNRGLIKSTIVEGGGGDAALMKRHYLYGQNEAMVVEAASGYTYAMGCNPNADIKFFKSCQVYKKPYVIESITLGTLLGGNMWDANGGTDYVKVSLATRMQHHDNATTDIALGASRSYLYNTKDPKFEDYRTDENGLLQYMGYPTTHADVKIGDLAHDSNDTGEGASFHGAIIPHFFFTKLIPKPYDDSNDTQDATDTRVTSDVMRQCELYLRSMCEGYIDDVMPESDDPKGGACNCGGGGYDGGSILFDWTYENLCYAAFGGRWVTMLPDTLRPDKPQGYGPLPNTGFYADVFNQLVKAVNKLVAVRVPLPMQLQIRYKYYRTVTANMGYRGSSALGQYVWKDIVTNPTTPANEITYPELATTEWESYNNQQITGLIWYTPSFREAGTAMDLEVVKRITEYKFEPINPDAIYALDSSWRSMIETNIGWVGQLTVYTYTGSWTYVKPSLASNETCNFYNPSGESFNCVEDSHIPLERCKLSGSGRFDVADYNIINNAGISYSFFYGNGGALTNLSNPWPGLPSRKIFIHGMLNPMGTEGAYLVVPTA